MAGLKAGAESYAAKYPGASVESVTIPNADFMAKFTLAVQGGGKPDTTMLAADRVPDMVGMGGLTDLTGAIARWDQKANFPADRFKAAHHRREDLRRPQLHVRGLDVLPHRLVRGEGAAPAHDL